MQSSLPASTAESELEDVLLSHSEAERSFPPEEGTP